jgi:hypothetical protein
VQRSLFASVGIALLFATASVAQQVKTDYDRSADFSQYKMYSRKNVQTQDQLWVGRIKDAVNAALNNRTILTVCSTDEEVHHARYH